MKLVTAVAVLIASFIHINARIMKREISTDEVLEQVGILSEPPDLAAFSLGEENDEEEIIGPDDIMEEVPTDVDYWIDESGQLEPQPAASFFERILSRSCCGSRCSSNKHCYGSCNCCSCSNGHCRCINPNRRPKCYYNCGKKYCRVCGKHGCFWKCYNCSNCGNNCNRHRHRHHGGYAW